MATTRWVMLAAIAFSAVLTLLGQPASFWQVPTTAIRGDSLSIYAPTNHTFDFFLGHGAGPFVLANLAYMAAMFGIVSRLRPALALSVIFAAIFAHGYGANNWLVVRFHFSPGLGPAACGALLGLLLSFAVLPVWKEPRSVINAWRWIMVVALFVDGVNTLIGQPASYWLNPATVHEANAAARWFLTHGWTYYVGYIALLAAGQVALLAILPVPVAFVSVFAFTVGSFVGGSNWFFYVWTLGWWAPVAYGLILSTLMVMLAFRPKR